MIKKRLKIAEQILIVLFLALIIPLIIAGAIIINTNQIAVRKELTSSAIMLANSLKNELTSFRNFEENNIYHSYIALNQMPNIQVKNNFLNTMKSENKNITDFSIVQLPQNIIIQHKFSSKYLPDSQEILFSYVTSDNLMTSKKVNLDYMSDNLFKNFNDETRRIYILDKNKNILMSKNDTDPKNRESILHFPVDENLTKPTVYGNQKNQPNVIIYLPDYEWYIVVSSPIELTSYGIVEARQKIIMAICIAAITVIILFGIYTYSLYTNIRQFFKIIHSIAEGNYTRKLRVLIQPFTSQEVIFIASEFNKMIEKIDESYSELNQSNQKLKKMDEYKSNLIDTVSHEFRTPLTSIKGYASSLLRHDVQLDDEAKKKSLRIIKHQAERLSRMVEDLLVIPDIESATLRMNYKEVNIKNIIETSVLYTSRSDTSIFNIQIDDNIPTVYSDEDRLTQILINLLENALKYSIENTPVSIFTSFDNDFVTVKVHNEAEFIDKSRINELFEKFTRIDSNLTRTTRGTGLGLFIVKGLVETMRGNISLNADSGFEVTFTIPVYKGQDVENV